MQLYLALVVVGLCLWEYGVAICPDGSSSRLPCDPDRQFVCPEGYFCYRNFPPSPVRGECCLATDYTCPVGHPAGYGSPFGLARCNAPSACSFPYRCKHVEETRTRIGICCP